MINNQAAITVAQLINQLQKLPQDMFVVITANEEYQLYAAAHRAFVSDYQHCGFVTVIPIDPLKTASSGRAVFIG